jgi:excisionase family DNA binding protein
MAAPKLELVSTPLLLRVSEVAALLSIGRSLAYQMITDGTLPSVRLGRCRRVPRADLERWIAAQTAAASHG